MNNKLLEWAIQLAIQEEMAKQIIHGVKSATETAPIRTNKTLMIEVDLTKEHVDTLIGLERKGRVYRWLTIERCDDSLNYRLKQTDGTFSNIFRAYEGARITQHDFLDIMITNPASTKQNAVCRFIVGYWE